MYRKLTEEQIPPSPRIIKYPECQEQFSPNIIKTSHYTWYNFIFLNLFEQFHRFANIFFLFLAIIQAIPFISPLNQLAGFVQLTFMLSITALKNAYEDFLRHKTDKEVNDRLVPVYKHRLLNTNQNNNHLLNNNDLQFSFKKWSDLIVSDVVRIDPNSEAPADCLIIETQSEEDKCRIETSALDGETFLKFKYPIFQNRSQEKVQNLTKDDHFTIHISPPTPNLKAFSGKILYGNNETIPLSLSNFIPRGCVSRNKKPFLAIVVYTGDDTKLIMNSMKPRFKFTELDQIMSKMAFYLLIIMFAICFAMTLLGKFWKEDQLNPKNNSADGYIKFALNDNQHWFLQFFSWIIDLQMIIPLAVYSSLDVVRFLLSFNISSDDKMSIEIQNENINNNNLDFDYSYSNKIDQNINLNLGETILKKSSCRNSDLVSSIGRVTHIFTDKTGTLTKNLMTFRSASFCQFELNLQKEKERIENDDVENLNLDSFIQHSLDNKDIWNFLMTIVLVNSVEVIDSQYMSNSPDELALLDFAKKCHFELIGNKVNSRYKTTTIKVKDKIYEIEQPVKFEFNSKRKRSSAICKINGSWILLVKGADSVIAERCNNFDEVYQKRLKNLGQRGLRTLCFAYKELSDETVNSIISEYEEKESLSVGSEKAIFELAERVETDLTVYAFSGVEDELQDDVFQTLSTIREAGIQVWMLTGDRLDTAIDVGRNCGLIWPNNSIITVNVKRSIVENASLESNQSNMSNSLKSDALNTLEIYVDGKLLDRSEDDNKIDIDAKNSVLCVDDADAVLNDLSLFSIANRCSSVIIARCEPLQKGNVIRLYKENVKTLEKMANSLPLLAKLDPLENSENSDSSLKNICESFPNFYAFRKLTSCPVVLAIGDGVNDVDMIRVADVGVAVEGREGSAAVLSSDFSVPTFSKLSRLLVVHGRWNCIRTSLLILVTFYKNLLLGLPQMFYGFYNGFSATSSFDSGYFALYNVILTIPQHFLACVIEEDIEDELCLKYPFVYRDYQKDGGFSAFNIVWFYFISIFHSVLIYFVPYFSLNLAILSDEFITFDHSLFTQIVGWNLMAIFTYEMFNVFHTISIFQALLNLACFLSNFAIQYFYSFVEGEYDSMLSRSGKAHLMWATVPLVVGISIVVDKIKDFLYPLITRSYTNMVIRKEKKS